MTKTIERPKRGITLPPLPEIDDVTRREFLIGAAGLLLLPAGCGGGEENGGEASGETRTIEHVMGTTEIPAEPRRIVAVDYNLLEELTVLGVKPVGSLYGSPEFLEEEAEGVEVVGGNDGTPNLERIASLDPDLIIAWESMMGDGNYEPLSEIAPTVVFERKDGFGNWRETLTFIAEILGREERAEEQLAEFDERAGRIRKALDERGYDEQEFSVFGSFNADFAVFNYVEGFPITILDSVGLEISRSQVEAYEKDPAAFDGMSIELLSRLDADVIFFLNPTLPSGGGGDGEFVEGTLKESPLFQQLTAVRNDRLCEVPYARWNEGSVIAANLILDDLEKALLGA